MNFRGLTKIIVASALAFSLSFGAGKVINHSAIASQQPTQLATTDPCAGGATAICADGSVSYSAHRRGTCSHHGGVATWCH